MSNIPISSLPVTISLDGSELVPVVQGGTTKRTTTAAIASLGSSGVGSTASFVFATDESALFPGARQLEGQSGVVDVTDNGGGSTIVVSLDAAGTAQFISAPRTVTAAGTVTVTDDDLAIFMRQSVPQAVNILLPAASDKVGPVYIADANGVSAANNFTIVPNGAETIVGLSSFVMNADYMSLNLRPVPGVGWLL